MNDNDDMLDAGLVLGALMPEWDKAHGPSDWQTYISIESRDAWETFSLQRKVGLASRARELAARSRNEP